MLLRVRNKGLLLLDLLIPLPHVCLYLQSIRNLSTFLNLHCHHPGWRQSPLPPGLFLQPSTYSPWTLSCQHLMHFPHSGQGKVNMIGCFFVFHSPFPSSQQCLIRSGQSLLRKYFLMNEIISLSSMTRPSIS